jgi:two-component system, sporulation sensor kinase A
MDDRNINTIINWDGPAPIVKVSEDQIHQVFLNIIINAIDAMPTGGQLILEIKNTTSPDGTKIIFQDTGIGIDQDQIHHLFDPFYTTKEDGLGLGLYICKEIIQYHKGTLEVNSENGKGTEFSVWLPDNAFDEELI